MTSKTDSRLALRTYPDEVRAHAHAHHQFVLPLSGALEMDVAGRGGLVDDVRGALVASGERHAFIGRPRADTGDSAARCVILDVPEAANGVLDAAAAQVGTVPFFALDCAMHHLLGFIAARGAADDGVQALLLATALDGLSAGRRPAEPRQLRRALTFMEARAHTQLTVRDIAEAAAVSESRLYQLFRTWVGRSPQAHLTEIRLRRARRALAGSDAAIAEIALAAGFADQTAFTRAFRRTAGTTPAAYRRRSRTL
jgi:AraC-like DNA-binding protein